MFDSESKPFPNYRPGQWADKEISARVLHGGLDEHYLLRAFAWKADKPRWWRESMKAWEKTEAEYLRDARRACQVDMAFFLDNCLSALITLVEFKPGVFECHIDSPRSMTLDYLIQFAMIAKQHAFDGGARELVLYIAEINRPMIKLIKEIGFIESNVRIIKGSVGERLIEWREFFMKKPEENSALQENGQILQARVRAIQNSFMLGLPETSQQFYAAMRQYETTGQTDGLRHYVETMKKDLLKQKK